MPVLIVRRLLIDMEQPIGRHWCDGDPFRTALFNALSMSFPVGEQFFIESVRNSFRLLAPAQQERFAVQVQGFIGQEATHRRLHSLYNAHLAKLGLVNDAEQRTRRRLNLLKGADELTYLAITAANEHFTAIMGNWMHQNADVVGTRDPRLATLWLWHGAEESEHKCIAFDLYKALGGDEEQRLIWFHRMTGIFIADALYQTIDNLRRDGTLMKWSTWKSAAAWAFGKRGFVRQLIAPWRDYKRADFHPSQQDSSAPLKWLEEHSDQFAPVGKLA